MYAKAVGLGYAKDIDTIYSKWKQIKNQFGKWHFGGQVFTAIQPRAGLLNAKYHILQNGDDLAEEVIRI